MDQDMPNTKSAGFGTTSSSERNTGPASDVCPTCGHSRNMGLEQFLGRLGINEEMVNTLKSQMQNVDIEQYLNTAREHLKPVGDKATQYAKENPGKVAAGVAALAVGAGLLISSLNRE